jgi:hypothetical protein
MALTTFTAAQVLTAAQMNAVQGNDYNQRVSTKTASYTLVAADKGTRIVMNVASANTVTVNTSLFSAGDTLVIQNIGAGVTTVTAGTATVSSAGPLAIPQYGSGTLYFTSAGVAIFFPSAVTVAAPAPSGLVVVKAETAFTTASSITADGVFTSSYTNYLLNIIYLTSSSGALSMKLRASSVATSSGYNHERLFLNTTTVSGSAVTNASTYNVGDESNGSFFGQTQIQFYAPQLAQATGIRVENRINNGGYGGNAIYFQTWSGNQQDSTQFDGLEINVGSGTTTGTYTIYGYGKTV